MDLSGLVTVSLVEGWLLIRLRSEAKPGVKSSAWVHSTEDRLAWRVGVAAGALAEHQCSRFKDKHDPAGVAKEAMALLPVVPVVARVVGAVTTPAGYIGR